MLKVFLKSEVKKLGFSIALILLDLENFLNLAIFLNSKKNIVLLLLFLFQ